MESYCVDTVWDAVAPLNQPKWSIQPLEAAEEMKPLVRKGLYLGGDSGWASSEHWAAAKPTTVRQRCRAMRGNSGVFASRSCGCHIHYSPAVFAA